MFLKEKKFFSIFITFCLVAFILLAAFFRSSVISLLLSVFGCLISIKIFVSLLKHRRLNFYDFLSYGICIPGTSILYLILGVENNIYYRFHNLIVALPSCILLFAIIILMTNSKTRKKKAVAVVLSAVMVVTSVLYCFLMTFKFNPKVVSLQEGHDKYLSNVSLANKSSPNVLIILMDDLGYSDISKYGYISESENLIHTPNIDSIGEDGAVFDNFYAAAPVCSPSRFGVLTGRYPVRGYVDNVFFPTGSDAMTRIYNSAQFKNGVDGILPDEITLAEVLNAAGYSTGAFGKWHLGDYGDYLPLKQGFDIFYGSYYSNDMNPYTFYKNDEVAIDSRSMDQRKITSLIEPQIMDFINDSISDGEKFFAYYASPWPHYPVFSGEDFKGTSAGGVYGDCIEEFDSSIGRIIDNLKEKGVYDDTIIIFTSDNGPWHEGGTGGLRGRKNTCYEGGQKVPFMISYPKAFSAIKEHIQTPTMGIDIFPTILSYCGIPLPTDRIIDGVDISPLLNGTVDKNQWIHDNIFYINGGDIKAVQLSAEINGKQYNMKYIDKIKIDNAAYPQVCYKNLLFNLNIDPLESYNQAENYPELANEMHNIIKNFQDDLGENRRGKIES